MKRSAEQIASKHQKETRILKISLFFISDREFYLQKEIHK